MIAFGAMLVSTMALSVITFAWINYNKTISDIHLTAGSIGISNLTTNVYKYVYPTYSGSTLVNYDGTGSVESYSSISTTTMNILDPTYITIIVKPTYRPDDTAAHDQSDVSRLNTNLVMKVSFDVSYPTNVNLYFSAVRNGTAYDPSLGNYGVSRYINYFGQTTTDFTAAQATLTSAGAWTGLPAAWSATQLANYKIWKTVKSVSENATNLKARSHFASDAADTASLDFFNCDLGLNRTQVTSTDANSSVYVSQSTTNFSFFVNLDYEDSLCNLFYDANHMGKTYDFASDYSFYLKLVQA